MFCGFNLTVNSELFKEEDYKVGRSLNIRDKTAIENDLEKFVIGEGIIEGVSLQDEWFPQIKADIFISHSHKDLEIAYGLVGWLYNNFKLKAFIDSNIWGSADDLLKTIDDTYCINNNESKTYSYDKRNFSTSHVHMMLAVALNKMIDNTECLFFLNTPKSTSLKDTINNSTFSPWIYSELYTSRTIRKRELKRYRKNLMKKRAIFENNVLTISYNIDTNHLINLNTKDLSRWQLKGIRATKIDSLDYLYYLKGLFKTNKLDANNRFFGI